MATPGQIAALPADATPMIVDLQKAIDDPSRAKDGEYAAVVDAGAVLAAVR